MKRFISLFAAVVFSFSANAADNELVMTDEGCSIVYSVTKAVADDLIKTESFAGFDYDQAMQHMYWRFNADMQNAEGLRLQQLVNAQVAVWWLRENNIMLSNAITRNFNRYGKEGTIKMSTGAIVADYVWRKCEQVEVFSINPLTVSRPSGKNTRM